MSPTFKFVKVTSITFNTISCDIHPLKMLSAMFLLLEQNRLCNKKKKVDILVSKAVKIENKAF